MPYTLGQAANAIKISKSTLSTAIKKGKLSATKNENGDYQIDPAELERAVSSGVLRTAKPLNTSPPETPDFKAENMALKAKLEVMQELLDQVKGERDNLREQNARITTLISAGRQEPEQKPQQRAVEALGAVLAADGGAEDQNAPKAPKKGFWGMFRRAG